MRQGKAFFIDVDKCTACRGCQVACKQWKDLPAEKTRNVGSHQNPQDLSSKTLKLVRFSEHVIDDKLRWLFFPDQCRHCIEPSCKYIANMYAKGAVTHDEKTGAVEFTEKSSKLKDVSPTEMCPYNIPRRDPETGVWHKCNMCIDRVQKGQLPSCVKTCPSDVMHFGEYADMRKLAEERLEARQEKYPDAQLLDLDDVRVIYLTSFAPEEYHEFSMAEAMPQRPQMTRRSMLAMFTGKKQA
ncbi:MAG: 4Fe-4S dicluster domain-containing protein [Desulfovibrio sp.]